TPRMIPSGRIGGDLGIVRPRPHRRESGQSVCLHLVEIHLARRGAPELTAGISGAPTGGHQSLPTRCAVAITRSDLKKGPIGEAAIGVAASGTDKSRQ